MSMKNITLKECVGTLGLIGGVRRYFLLKESNLLDLSRFDPEKMTGEITATHITAGKIGSIGNH